MIRSLSSILPRRFVLAALLGMALGTTAVASDPAADSRPNFLFLLSDDQRADTIHALGNRRIRTPNLDRLVHEGTTFTRAHILGALQGAVCVPSRAMILSGRSLFRVREDLRNQETWPRQLRRAGWRTFLTGKWHNGAASVAASFEEGRSVFLGGMTDQNLVAVRDLQPDGRLGPVRTDARPSSEIFADEAVAFLRRADPGHPFCLYVAFTSPHDPRTPPEAFGRLYNPARLPVPPNFLPRHPFDNGEMAIRDEQLLPWPRTEDAIRRELAAYYGMISHVDAQVGRILDALEASGRYHRTVIVFAGDNGLALGSHGLLGKQNLYEHSTRVPLILAGPGIRANRRSDALVALHDLAPTLCGLAGVPAPEGSEGLDLAPLLHGAPFQRRSVLFTAYRDLQRAVTDGRWKLIEYPKIGRHQLFDLRRDPAERHDLAGSRRHGATLDRLVAALREQQQAAADPLATQDHAPVP